MLDSIAARMAARSACLLSLLALAGGAGAQTTAPATSPTPGAEAGASHSAKASVAQFRAVRMSRLIGMPVQSPKGEAVGTVRDLIVNANNARVRYLVLEPAPGLLGADRLVPVPMTEFKLDPQQPRLSYSPNRDRLQGVALAKAEWSDAWLQDAKRLAALDRAWGLGRPLGSAPKLRRGSSLIGQPVQSAKGEPIGKIHDLVVHLNQQRANYAVVRFDAQWAGEDKRLAVPMNRFKSGEGFVVDLNQDRVKATQGISHAQDQNPNERSFVAEIDRQLATFAGSTRRDR
ncbi:PRC-barrel domain-containing protein [Ramlibacter rhizophilus]|nr:PRC-barrel domain-containing protein [Ramlibacter rhizophilus]